MLLRRADLGAIEREPRASVVGPKLYRLGVFDDGEIVILTLLREVCAPQGTGRGTAASQNGAREAHDRKRSRHAATGMLRGETVR